MFLVREFVNYGMVCNDKIVWNLLLTKKFDTIEQANEYKTYRKNEFGHSCQIYKRDTDKWVLIENNLY